MARLVLIRVGSTEENGDRGGVWHRAKGTEEGEVKEASDDGREGEERRGGGLVAVAGGGLARED